MVDEDARQFKDKRNFICSAPTPCPKNVPAPLTVPIANALHYYAFVPVFHCFVSERRIPSLVTAGCERKDEKFYII